MSRGCTGLTDGGALLDLLRPEVDRVAGIYRTLGTDDGRRLSEGAQPLEAELEAAGFAEPAAARARIEGWRSGKVRSLRTNAAREAFEAMLPELIDAFGFAPDPMQALNRFDDLVVKLPTGVNFFRLLEARPMLTQHLERDPQPRAGARRAARPPAGAARRADRRQRLRAGAAMSRR